jgi:hypothetical protein
VRGVPTIDGSGRRFRGGTRSGSLAIAIAVLQLRHILAQFAVLGEQPPVNYFKSFFVLGF